jgi:hypothetical protein
MYTKVIVSADGKAQDYDQYTGGISVGDSLEMELSYDPAGNNLDVILQKQNNQGLSSGTYASGHNGGAKIVAYTDGSVRVRRKDDYIESVIQFSPDAIKVSTLMENLNMDLSDTYLTMNRYFKNDWEGIVVKKSARGQQILALTVDCRTKNGSVDAVLSKIRSSL